MSVVFTLSDLTRGGAKRKAGGSGSGNRLTQWKKLNRPAEHKKVKRTIRNGVLVVETESESGSDSEAAREENGNERVKEQQKDKDKDKEEKTMKQRKTDAAKETDDTPPNEEKRSADADGGAAGSRANKRKSAKPRRHVSQAQLEADEDDQPSRSRAAASEDDGSVAEVSLEDLDRLDPDALERRLEKNRRVKMNQRYDNTMKKHREDIEKIMAKEDSGEVVKGLSLWRLPASLERLFGLPVGSNGFLVEPAKRSMAMTSTVRQHCYESRESNTITVKCEKSEENENAAGGKCKIAAREFEKWRNQIEKEMKNEQRTGEPAEQEQDEAADAAVAMSEEEQIRLAIELSINEARQQARLEPKPVSSAAANPARLGQEFERPHEIVLSDSEVEEEKRPAKSSSAAKSNAKPAHSSSSGSFPQFHCPHCDSVAHALINTKFKFFDAQNYTDSVIYLPYPQLEALSTAYYDHFGASGFKKSDLSENCALLLWNYYKRYGTISAALKEIFGMEKEKGGDKREFEPWKNYEEEGINAWSLAGNNRF